MSHRPSLVRYGILVATALMAVLLYLDRFCITIAEIYLAEELRLTKSDVGMITGVFFLTYALAQVPSGWLTDRFGPRRMLTLYIVAWSVFTGLMGGAASFASFLLARALIGVAQAGAYPTSASLLRTWMPTRLRATASSIVSTGGRLGGALAPLLTGYLILMYVPLEVSPDLTPNEVMNPSWLARQFAAQDESPGEKKDETTKARERVSRHVLDLLGAPDATLESLAARHTTAVDEATKKAAPPQDSPPKETKLSKKPVSVNPACDRPEIEAVVAYLNRVLEEPRLYDQTVFAGFKLEREADRLLRLKEPSPQEVRRLNRLLLEAVFGDAIQKLYGRGWRPVMGAYGAAGLVVALLFWLVHRDRPEKHPWCNDDERALLDAPPPTAAPVRGVPIGPILASGSLWLNCMMQFFINVGWVLLMTWTPRYFAEVHKFGIEQRAWMATLTTAAGLVGMLLGGWLADWTAQVFGRRWGRVLPMAVPRFLAMGAYLAILTEPSPETIVALFCVVAFFTDLGIPAIWAFVQDVGGRYTATILGWGNMFGNLGAALASWGLIYVVGDDKNWNRVFLLCSVAFCIAGVAALGMDATRPIVREDRESA